MSASIELNAVGPVDLLNPVLLNPQPIRLAGADYGSPRYGVRLLLRPGPALDRLLEGVASAQAMKWPDGLPRQFFNPITPGAQIGLASDVMTVHPVAPQDHPPALYVANGGDAVPFDAATDRRLLHDGATALVSLELTPVQPLPWGGAVDIRLIAVLLTGEGRRSNATASAFREALSREAA